MHGGGGSLCLGSFFTGCLCLGICVRGYVCKYPTTVRNWKDHWRAFYLVVDGDEIRTQTAHNTRVKKKSEIKSHIKRDRVSFAGNPLAVGHKMCRGRRQLNLPPLKAVIFHFSKRFQRFGSPRPDVADKTRNHPAPISEEG